MCVAINMAGPVLVMLIVLLYGFLYIQINIFEVFRPSDELFLCSEFDQYYLLLISLTVMEKIIKYLLDVFMFLDVAF